MRYWDFSVLVFTLLVAMVQLKVCVVWWFVEWRKVGTVRVMVVCNAVAAEESRSVECGVQ